MSAESGVYRGRFAPSPTGPLHLGSLLAALASFLDARAAGGTWLLRIEDIDPPREIAGASERIVNSLRCHGLAWDGDILWQSTRHAAYREALAQLRASGAAFPCSCTRALLGPGGSCGRRCSPARGDHVAWRLEVDSSAYDASMSDGFLGQVTAEAGTGTPGDVVIWRKDDLPAYQLAVVVDDIWQQVTHVVRGADLLEQTDVQRYLMGLLGYDPPAYAHLPLLCADDGRKLSKQNGAPGLDDSRPLDNLRLALKLLRQPAAEAGSPEALLAVAARQWRPRAFADLGRRLHYTEL